jgi:putative hydrolase
MTDVPFGFSPGEGGDDIAGKIPLFAELQKLMSWSGGPVNWDLARQVAIAAAAAADTAVSGDAETADALRLADLWLEPLTTLPSGVRTTAAWNHVAWIERTLAGWARLCDPVAAKVVAAMAGALPEEVREQAGPLAGMMGQFGGLMFGAQVGQALGQLAGEVLSATDIGVPLADPGTAALLPANVAAFGEGLEVPAAEVRLYVALREAAHQRLFAHVPWLRGHLVSAVEAYAAGIAIDMSALDQAMTSLDPTNPDSIQDALGTGLFGAERTPEQTAALARLETALALVEGWVDDVVGEAAAEHLPNAAALSETMRRRRATGGPAEQTFATLVGLELRPRRLREAATLWRWLREQRGIDGRDAVWGHPDLLPVSADLADPVGYVRGEPHPE